VDERFKGNDPPSLPVWQPEESSSLSTAPTRVGPYEIVAPLGAGGMGEVYRARDTRLGREVALKLLPSEFVKDTDRLARFELEAKAVAALAHPNILVLYDFGTDQGVPYATTELLEGETLRQRLKPAALPWRKAVETAVAIADGLAAAHGKGIVHRDLKPDNIFLTSDERVKILDFGLAKVGPLPLVEGSATRSYSPSPTKTGVVLGTAPYMSPEQLRGQPVDARTDFFSFGCVLYEMLSGGRPFTGNTDAELVAAILHEDPPDLTASSKGVPVELQRLVSRCLEKNPEARFQSARDLAFALRSVASNLDLGTTAEARTSRHLRTISGVGTGLVLAGMLVAAVLLLRRDSQSGGGPAPVVSAQGIDSVAVLPFDNLSADVEAGSLGDDITYSLTEALMRVRDLKVRPYTSAARHKGKDIDARSAGRALEVQAVVKGLVNKRDDKLIVIVDVIDIRDQDRPIVTARYEGLARDRLRLQQQIVTELPEKLRLTLTGEQKQDLAKLPTRSLQAHELYVRGRLAWNRRTIDDMKLALDYFDQAIQLDPAFAQAYAGKADCLILLPLFGLGNPKDTFPRAREAALQSLQQDPTIGEAHISLGQVKFMLDWDFPGAEEEFRRGLELKPAYPTGHHWYGIFLINTNRPDAGVSALKRAKQLDSESLIIRSGLATAYTYARSYDDAVAECQAALVKNSNYAVAHSSLGWVLALQRKYAEAITELEAALRLDPDNPDYQSVLAHTYAAVGKTADARGKLQRLRNLSQHGDVSPVYLATIHVALGERDQALAEIERGFREHSPGLLYLLDPLFDPLRNEPRFQKVLADMKLLQ
jgi:serine/threonine protein kinase/TolB-like protein/cytochrome c-type biogenesis protein CcmH/NrfG